jgi:hypothetical protein
MNDDRDFWRATTDWLEAGSDRTSAAAIDAVLLAVRTTRQERALPFPWRRFHGPLLARVAFAAAALVALALVAFTLILAGSRRQGPIALIVNDGDIETQFTPGQRYATIDPFPVHMTFTGPEDWEGKIGGPYAVWIGTQNPGAEPLMFHLSISPYKDPCHSESENVSPSTTVSGVVDALKATHYVEVTDAAATIGGRSAVLLTATAPGSLADCTDQTFRLWKLPLGAIVELSPGATERIWVVDVGAAGPLVIGAQDHLAWPPQVGVATDQLLDSLQIEPSN